MTSITRVKNLNITCKYKTDQYNDREYRSRIATGLSTDKQAVASAVNEEIIQINSNETQFCLDIIQGGESMKELITHHFDPTRIGFEIDLSITQLVKHKIV